MGMVEEVLMEEYEVVEMRGGAVYKTRPLGRVWVRMGSTHPLAPQKFYGPLSTSVSKTLPYNEQFRRREV